MRTLFRERERGLGKCAPGQELGQEEPGAQGTGQGPREPSLASPREPVSPLGVQNHIHASVPTTGSSTPTSFSPDPRPTAARKPREPFGPHRAPFKPGAAHCASPRVSRDAVWKRTCFRWLPSQRRTCHPSSPVFSFYLPRRSLCRQWEVVTCPSR